MGFVNTCVLTDSMEWRGSWPLLLFVLAVFNEHKGSTWIAWCVVFVGTERGVSQIRLAQGGTSRRMALRGIGVSLVWVHEQWRLWLPHLRSPWQWTSRQPRGMGETSANFLCPFQESKVFPHLDFPDHTPLGGSSETEGPDAEAWDCSLEASHTLAAWQVGTCVQNVLNLVIYKRGPVRQHRVSTCVSSVWLTDDCRVWLEPPRALQAWSLPPHPDSILTPDPFFAQRDLWGQQGPSVSAPSLQADFVIAEPVRAGDGSPLLGCQGDLFPWERRLAGAGLHGRGRVLSPMEALVSHPGEGGRKEGGGQFLGLGTCWMDDLESALGEGGGW